MATPGLASSSSDRSKFSISSQCSTSDSKYNLRTKSIQNRLDVERRQIEPRSPKPKQRPAPLSKYRRRTANFRERCRMQEMNNAFKRLQSVVPALFLDSPKVDSNAFDPSKVTKISTLKLAVDYISALTAMLNSQNEQQFNNHSVHNNNNQSPILNHTLDRENIETLPSAPLRVLRQTPSSYSENVYYDSTGDEPTFQHMITSNVNNNSVHQSPRVMLQEDIQSLPIAAPYPTPSSTFISHHNPQSNDVHLSQHQGQCSPSSNSPKVIAHSFNYSPYQAPSHTGLSHSHHHPHHHQAPHNAHHHPSHHLHHHHPDQHHQNSNILNNNNNNSSTHLTGNTLPVGNVTMNNNNRIVNGHCPAQHDSFTRVPLIHNPTSCPLSSASSLLSDEHSLDCVDFFDHQTDILDELGELIDTFSDDLL